MGLELSLVIHLHCRVETAGNRLLLLVQSKSFFILFDSDSLGTRLHCLWQFNFRKFHKVFNTTARNWS